MPLLPPLQLGHIRVTGGARAEDPTDHKAHEEHRRDEDEMSRGHGLLFVFPASCRSSVSTRPIRRQVSQT
jgi:hypothetical protein